MYYPDEFIRGISTIDCLDKNGRVSAALFQFEEVEHNADYLEMSINWYDDDGALTEIFERRKDNGALQFRFGATILSRHELDASLLHSFCDGVMKYRRDELPDNPYHGNLLLLKGLGRVQRHMYCGIIALCFKKTRLPESE